MVIMSMGHCHFLETQSEKFMRSSNYCSNNRSFIDAVNNLEGDDINSDSSDNILN